MKRDFVALISHEMRTPLTVIDGFAELMGPRWDQLDADQRSRQVMAVKRNTARLDRLVGNVLQAAALDRDPVTAGPDDDLPVDVHRLVMAVLDDAQVSRADVTIDCPSGAPLHVDRAALRTILSHLVTNPRKYGSPPIHIAVTVGEAILEVVVSDHGPGVPPAFASRLFGQFTQVSAGDRRTATGTGLGLWIARTLARSHGGDLVYAPGSAGASFRLRLGHRGPVIGD